MIPVLRQLKREIDDVGVVDVRLDQQWTSLPGIGK